MKVCNKCGVNERVHHRTICSKCNYQNRKDYKASRHEKDKEYNRWYRKNIWYPKQKDGIYRVYALPNANYYVGQCEVISVRMNRHRNTGKDTTDFIILHKCKTRKEAKWYEAVYHEIGFPGYNNGL